MGNRAHDDEGLRLSHTQINMYLEKCPRQYAYRYIEGIKTPPNGTMKRSNVGHSVIEQNYKQKVVSRQDLPVDDITDMYATFWREELEREEVIFEQDEKPDEVRDEGIAATKEHRLKIAPLVMAASEQSVEEWFEETLPIRAAHDSKEVIGRYTLIGKIDLIDSNARIRDNKIIGARKLITAEDIAKDHQLSIYAIAYRRLHKQAESGVTLDTVKLLKDGPQARILDGLRTKEFLLEELNTIAHVARGIEHQVFPKRTNGWWCSEKFCGYWSRCMGRNLTVVDLLPLPDSDKPKRRKGGKDRHALND